MGQRLREVAEQLAASRVDLLRVGARRRSPARRSASMSVAASSSRPQRASASASQNEQATKRPPSAPGRCSGRAAGRLRRAARASRRSPSPARSLGRGVAGARGEQHAPRRDRPCRRRRSYAPRPSDQQCSSTQRAIRVALLAPARRRARSGISPSSASWIARSSATQQTSSSSCSAERRAAPRCRSPRSARSGSGRRSSASRAPSRRSSTLPPLDVEADRLEQVAVGAELRLVGCAVAGADGLRAAIAVELELARESVAVPSSA